LVSPSGSYPALVDARDGGVFFAWTDTRTAIDATYGSRFDANGALSAGCTPSGDPVANTTSEADLQAIAADAIGGSFVLFTVFTSDTLHLKDLYLTRTDGAMHPLTVWPTAGLGIETGREVFTNGSMVPDGAGGVFVGWDSHLACSSCTNTPVTMRLKRIRPDGSLSPGWPSNGVAIATGTQGEAIEDLVADGAGGCFVVFLDSRNAPSYSQYVQHLMADGSLTPGWPLGGRRLCAVASNQYAFRNTSALLDGAGGLYVAWDDDREKPPSAPPYSLYGDIYLQHLDITGAPLAPWPSTGLPVHVGAGAQWDPQLCTDGAGGVIVTWLDWSAGMGAITRITPAGNAAPGWTPGGQPVCVTGGYTNDVQPVTDGQGGAYLAFIQSTGGDRAYAQHFQGDGTFAPGWALNGTLLVDIALSGQAGLTMCTAGPGSAVAAWSDQRVAGGSGLRAQKLVPDGVVPTQLALQSCSAGAKGVQLMWWGTGAAMATWQVDRTTDGAIWDSMGSPRATSDDRIEFLDASVKAGGRYGYRLTDGSGRIVVAATWIDVPVAAVFALNGAAPNPARLGALSVRFSLAEQHAGTLELLDVAGRRLAWRDIGSLSPGSHTMPMPETQSLAPGIHWLRLRQGTHQAFARVVLTN
jgi:hypothetical protein